MLRLSIVIFCPKGSGEENKKLLKSMIKLVPCCVFCVSVKFIVHLFANK